MDSKIAVGYGTLARRLCEALGLERCRSLTLSMSMDEAVTVKAECLTNENELEEVVLVLEELADQQAISD